MDVSTESEFYNFPPFFTLQPVEQTQEKQLQLWRRLILDYFTKNTKENILTLASFDLFQNDQIQRKLDDEGRLAVANNLLKSGHGQWQDENNTLYVFVKTPSEWASVIYDFVQKNGLTGTIYTMYELHSGDLTRNTPIQGIDPQLCVKALETLESTGKAQVFPGSDSIDETGVKFL